jgi:hypothetical protein
MLSIAGLDKADVLAALYNASRPLGMGFMHYDPAPMTRDQAAAVLAQGTYFDYLKGRVMKIDLSKDDQFEEWLYDRDNGDGAAARALAVLRQSSNVAAPEIVAAHKSGVLDAADNAKQQMQQQSGQTSPGVFTLGLADVAGELAPKVEAAVNRSVD